MTSYQVNEIFKKKGGNGWIMYSWLSYDGVKNLMYCTLCKNILLFKSIMEIFITQIVIVCGLSQELTVKNYCSHTQMVQFWREPDIQM